MPQFSDTLPRYAQIAAAYQRQIESGELAPGDKLPSFAEVRAQLGVGQSTLERAHELLEREALIIREPGRGIFVARPAARPRTNVIGLSGIHGAKGQHPYFSQLLDGVYEAAHKAGKEILLMHEDVPVSADKIEGVLLYSPRPEHWIRRLPPGLPCVSLLTPARGVASVVADDYRGLAAAVNHLHQLGHERIAYMAAWPENVAIQRRCQAYRDTLQGHGITPSDSLLRYLPDPAKSERREEVFSHFIAWGEQVMLQWLSDGWASLGATALLVHNDDTAIGAMRALQANGYSIPGDLSIVGFDDTLNAQLVQPALTTVHVPLKQMGEAAMNLLLGEIDGLIHPGNADFTQNLEPRLVHRASSDQPPLTKPGLLSQNTRPQPLQMAVAAGAY